MSFKSFSAFSQALAKLQAQLDQNALLVRIVNRVTTLIENSKSIPTDYIQKYNSVQLLQYNSEGELQDVTPVNQLTIPQAVLDKAKSVIESNLRIIDSDVAVASKIPGTNVGNVVFKTSKVTTIDSLSHGSTTIGIIPSPRLTLVVGPSSIPNSTYTIRAPGHGCYRFTNTGAAAFSVVVEKTTGEVVTRGKLIEATPVYGIYSALVINSNGKLHDIMVERPEIENFNSIDFGMSTMHLVGQLLALDNEIHVSDRDQYTVRIDTGNTNELSFVASDNLSDPETAYFTKPSMLFGYAPDKFDGTATIPTCDVKLASSVAATLFPREQLVALAQSLD